MTTTRLDPSTCPTCGKLNDAATSVRPGQTPDPGDVAICWGCGEVMLYDDDLHTVVCDDETIRNDPQVVLVRAEIIGARSA